MATHVLTSVTATVGGVDFSDHIDSLTIEVEADNVDFTNFGSSGWKESKGGLKSYNLQISWQHDFASSEVYATIFGSASAVANLGTSLAWTGKATSAATGTTNPIFGGNVLMTGGSLIAGSVGDGHKFSTTWPGTGAITVATS